MEIRLVGLCLARPGLGIPLASTDTPSGGIVPFTVRRPLPRVRSSCSMIEPRGSLICIVVVLPSSRITPDAAPPCLPRGRPRCVTGGRLTTFRPSFQRSPLHRLGSRGAHSCAHVAVLASGIGRQPLPCSAFVVFHHLDGLLLLDPLRMLHRSSGHGVRDVSSSTPLLSSSRGPALRSLAPCT
jgi:hypothetical protein